MVVIISVAHLSGDSLEISVQRPQHDAHASRTYPSLEEVRTALLDFGITKQVLAEYLKLLPQLGSGQPLRFPPVDVPHHDLVAEGFKIGMG
jgi:hypothetical protein